MLKVYCDNCGKEIQVSSDNEVYLKIAKKFIMPFYLYIYENPELLEDK